MKFVILCIGRLKGQEEQSLVTRYLERLAQIGGQQGFAAPELVELSESRARTPEQRKKEEAIELRKKIPAGGAVYALDERGRTLSSLEFSNSIKTARDSGIRHLSLVIGGPDGLDQDFSRNASLTLSFGRMTLPHGLVRVVLAEQLYRAVTIMAGHPYHRE